MLNSIIIADMALVAIMIAAMLLATIALASIMVLAGMTKVLNECNYVRKPKPQKKQT